MPKKEYYNVTPEQRELALWRDAKRKQLRELYLKDSGHPTKSLLFDSALHRFAAARMSVQHLFVPTALSYLTKMGTITAVIVLTAVILKKRKAEREHLYRTGQVSYADRPYKFL